MQTFSFQFKLKNSAMEKIKNVRSFMRIVHRYLGYFMAGIMLVYAVSGIILIYRDTDFLKSEKHCDKIIEKNLSEKDLKEAVKVKGFEILKKENGLITFNTGTYEPATGHAKYSKKELPFVLDKMTKLHLAKSEDTFSPLNAFFGVCLLFFVISSFWMFNIKSKVFKRGLLYTAAGLVLALLLLFL